MTNTQFNKMIRNMIEYGVGTCDKEGVQILKRDGYYSLIDLNNNQTVDTADNPHAFKYIVDNL